MEEQEKKEPYSFHTFIFPFLWEGTDFKSFVSYFAPSKNNQKWTDTTWKTDGKIPKDEKMDSFTLYKEYQYFHSHVRKAIYGYKDDVVRNFQFNTEENNKDAFYIIQKDNKEIKLHIKSIQLKIYNTEVALLIMQCENYENKSLEDVKNINDYGRRVYAPFINKNNRITADELRVELPDGTVFIENFAGMYEEANKETENGEKTNPFNTKSGNMLEELLSYKNKELPFQIYPALDDRMFVLCWVCDKERTEKMLSKTKDDHYFYQKNEKAEKSLYELAFVDPSGRCSCQNSDMRRKLLEKCVYRRWLDYKSIYTITYQAVVMLSAASVTDNYYLYENFMTQYFQMLCLCLAERASIIRFYQKVQIGASKMQHKEIISIQKQFLSFRSQLCFEEVTSQEQGIEFFQMMKSAMFIDKELERLKDVIGNLYETDNISLDNNLNNIALGFAIISVFLAIASMILDVLSVSKVSVWGMPYGRMSWRIIAICTLVSFGTLLWSMLFSRWRNR